MNKKKTEVMCNEITKKQSRSGISVDAVKPEEVEEYKYFRKMVTPKNEISVEINQTVNAAWRRFGKYSPFLNERNIPASLKWTIMTTVSIPTLTYGAETWALMTDQFRKLATSQRRIERSILNISLKDKIRNETIRERTKVKDVIKAVRDLKSRWAGHVARMEDKRWAKIITEWNPRG